MNLKEELQKLKNKLLRKQSQESNNESKVVIVRAEDITEEEKHLMESARVFRGKDRAKRSINQPEDIELNSKIDNFIDWYFENMIKGNYTEIGEFHKPNEMRNFIEKVAVWYELRYPNYEINRLMPGSEQEKTKVDDVMFKNNEYVREIFSEKSNSSRIEWAKFYNTDSFIESLPSTERYLLKNARYKRLVYIDLEWGTAHLHLTSNGIVEEAEGVENYTNSKVKDKDLKGLHIKDVVRIIKENGIVLPVDNELEEAIRNVEKWNYQREELLNCIMYRIIERGGNRIGPRRAFLFAKEFGRNIDIPMMYGVDFTDPGLRSFVNEYIKAGGHKDLLCYVDYFFRKSKNEKLNKVSIDELLRIISYDYKNKYTPEERDLYQRLVNALVSRETQENEKAKKLRLEKK